VLGVEALELRVRRRRAGLPGHDGVDHGTREIGPELTVAGGEPE
jgi:hypothetical protein